jgi:gliding motility-associated-like protein
MKGWHVQVFNRNGIKLYDGTDGWNGMYNNKPVSKDTYFYVLYYTFETETKTHEGYLMVVR